MPANPTYPGVYVEEVPTGAKLIEGVSTSSTAFVGTAKRGPLRKPKRVTSFLEYKQTFGDLIAGSEMGYAVKQFFANGGIDAWIVRVSKSGTASSGLKLKASDLAKLDAAKDLSLLCLPGVGDATSLAAADAYCKSRWMFLIVDAPKSAALPADMLAAAANLPKSESAAVYYPWINIADPLAGGKSRLSAPSGAIAGMYARVDAKRGVWKAPAGNEATLSEVLSLAHAVTDLESGTLNSQGVNSLRALPDQGIVAWGARTLIAARQANSEWKYVNVRRLFLFLERSIDEGLQWVVFEPNDEALWARVRTTVSSFLNRLFLAGAFQGSTSRDAWFVRCDRTTMTQDDIDNGRLICEVGFAPVKPAEFVIFRIGKMTSSSP